MAKALGMRYSVRRSFSERAILNGKDTTISLLHLQPPKHGRGTTRALAVARLLSHGIFHLHVKQFEKSRWHTSRTGSLGIY